MALQGWTPINSTIAFTDKHGINTYDILRLPLLPPPEHQKPTCQHLGHDLRTHRCGQAEEDSAEREPAASSKESRPKKSKPKQTRSKGAKDKHHVYHPETPDEAIFDGDPDLINHDNLFRLAQKYPIKDIANAVNESHGENTLAAQTLSNRLTRSIDMIAKRDGRDRDEVYREHQQAKERNGLTCNGRKRKMAASEGEKEASPTKKLKDGDGGGEKKPGKKPKGSERLHLNIWRDLATKKRKKAPGDDGKQKEAKKQKMDEGRSGLESDKENVEVEKEAKPDRHLTPSGFIMLNFD